MSEPNPLYSTAPDFVLCNLSIVIGVVLLPSLGVVWCACKSTAGVMVPMPTLPPLGCKTILYIVA